MIAAFCVPPPPFSIGSSETSCENGYLEHFNYTVEAFKHASRFHLDYTAKYQKLIQSEFEVCNKAGAD